MSTKTKLSAASAAKRTKPVSRAPKKSKPRKAAPVAKSLRSMQRRDPIIKNNGTSITVSHREFITDVAGSVLFTATGFPINPGRDVLFPWLSKTALSYERYQFHKLKFCYEPRCPTSFAGAVIIAVDFDPLDALPTTKQAMYSYSGCAQSIAWDDCSNQVAPNILASRGTLFVRAGSIPSTSDLKTYDLGQLILARSGQAATTVVGELFVEYTVTLSIPQSESVVQSGTYAGTAGVSKSVPFGTAPLVPTGLLDVTYSGTTVTFQQNWEGDVAIFATGVGAAAIISGGGTTATVTVINTTLAASTTEATVVLHIVALRGQTFICEPSGAWTSISAMTFRFTPTL